MRLDVAWRTIFVVDTVELRSMKTRYPRSASHTTPRRVTHMETAADRPVTVAERRSANRKWARALRAPILWLEIYLAATVFIYFFGPVEWYVPSPLKLVTFLGVNYGALWLGYTWGTKRGENALKRAPVDAAATMRLPRQVLWLIVFSMLFSIVSNAVRLSAIRGDAGAVLSSFVSPGEAYRKAQLVAQMDRDGDVMPIADYSWAFRISTLLAVFNGLYLPLALVYWRRLRAGYRLLFFVTVAIAVVYSVGLGAQSGIGFLVFASLPVVLYRIYVIARPTSNRTTGDLAGAKTRVAHRLQARLVVVVSLAILVATIAFFQLDRAEDAGRRLDAARDLGGQYASSSDSGILSKADERLNYGVVMACLYVSHGYEGLALSMELPFQWTYGLGWSKALQMILSDYLGGPDLFKRSYILRNNQEHAWPTAWWSTIFPWIASDATFYGTAVVMFFVGFVTARCWVDVILTGNPIGFAVLGQLFTLVFMFPANNALAQSLEGLFSFVGVIWIYKTSRKHFRASRSAY